MKTVKFSVTEDEYTFLKNSVGFDHLENILRPAIKQAMEKVQQVMEKEYGRINNSK